MLQEVAGLSDKLSLEIKDFVADRAVAEQRDIPRIPAFELEGQAKGRVRFFGVPAGYEFSAVLQEIIDVSTGDTGLAAASLARLAGLREDVHLQVFTTPT